MYGGGFRILVGAPPVAGVNKYIHTSMGVKLKITHHNQPTRPTTHLPHVPCTAPYAWEVHWWALLSWVISLPFTPILTLRAGPSHLSARSERYLRNAFELEGAVWCVLISGRSLMRLYPNGEIHTPHRPQSSEAAACGNIRIILLCSAPSVWLIIIYRGSTVLLGVLRV